LPQHDHYEELCALAVSGQISAQQANDLAEHTTACAGCQILLDDFAQIAAQALPEYCDKHKAARTPIGMKERFLARARSEGLHIGRKSALGTHRRWDWRRAFILQTAIAVPILVVAVPVELYRSYHENATVRISPANDGVPSRRPVDDRKDLQEQLAKLQAHLDERTRIIDSERQALESAEADKVQLNGRLAEIERQNVDLNRGLADRENEAAQLNAEMAQTKATLENLSSVKARAELAIQADQAELKELRLKVASLDEQLSESQELSAAANQAKDLIVARNLHIVDVDDTDGAGRRQRPFGRIFYTEGKNLVFYAYDLNDTRKLNAKINFYVWGSREGDNKPVRSLGIFRSDDPKDARWVLKFDDPRVLAQINCVFVTAESAKKEVKQPTGQQILFASLGATNHP
jgi:hypothetical protein